MKWLRILAVVLAVLVAAACQAGTDDTEDGEPAAGEQETDPDVAQDLVVGAPEDTYVTEGENANLGMFPVNANIFETLVFMTPDFQLEPGLATDWEYLGDNTWQFELRDDVEFHDGQPFDAEAALFSLERLAEAYGPRLSVGPDSMEVVDDRTINVTTTEPNLALPDQLVHPSIAPMIAPGTDVGTEPTGTGPFRFVEYEAQEQLVVERNDDYWGDPAELDTITFRFIPDGQSRWLSLQTDEVDVIYDLPRELLPEAQETAEVQLGFEPGVTPAGSTEVMFLNHRGEEPYTTLAEAPVRQALSHAIDRQAIVDDVWGESADLSDTMVPATLLGDHADIIEGPSYDPDLAEELLDEAGWTREGDDMRSRDGTPLELVMINGYPPIDIRQPMPELVQAQLREVGIAVEIVETPELGTYTDRLDAGEGDIFLERVAQNDATPYFFARAFFYSESEGPYAQWFAAGNEFDAVLEEAFAQDDRDQAQQLTAEAMSIAIDDEAVVIPMAAAHWLFVMSEDVEGFVPHGSARLVRWDTVHLEG